MFLIITLVAAFTLKPTGVVGTLKHKLNRDIIKNLVLLYIKLGMTMNEHNVIKNNFEH